MDENFVRWIVYLVVCESWISGGKRKAAKVMRWMTRCRSGDRGSSLFGLSLSFPFSFLQCLNEPVDAFALKDKIPLGG